MTVILKQAEGVYYDILFSGRKRRFTAYVGFADNGKWYTSAQMKDLAERNRADVEEIDTDAGTEMHAREITTAALKRDFEPCGVIISVEEK